MLQLYLAQSASSYTPSMSPTPRPTSALITPQVARPFRLSSAQPDLVSNRRHSKLPELLTRKRTSSLPHRKDTETPHDPFTAHPSGSASFVTYEASSPASPSNMSSLSPQSSPLTSLPKRARGSLLIPSGITLPFARPRNKSKKTRPPPPSTQFMFSEVIEISAPPPLLPEEDEDRERLRDAAAQSIGLDPVLLEDRESISSRSHTRSFSLSHARSERSRSRSRSRSHSRSPTRSRAKGAPSRAETPVVRSLPPFPACQSALAPWLQRSSRVAKHYPPTSLLLFALAKQWKSRVLVLTSSPSSVSGPPTHTTSFSSQSPLSTHSSASLPQNVAHLHLFKSDNGGDRELERVEIGADSVVFVSEDDIGGRRGVVKVGGVGGVEMTLSMVNQGEAQNWIAAIKHAVLSERSVRAGLGAMSQSNGVEPRGDLDVMLSMRAQGIFTPPPASAVLANTSVVVISHDPTASTTGTTCPPPSLRSASPQLQRPPSVAVSALRGLFGANRPRSPSGPTTDVQIPERGGAETPPPPEDSSFGRAGTSLLGMLRLNSISSERPLSPITPISSVPSTPRVGTTSPSDLPVQMGLISPPVPPPALDQKILQDKDRESLLPSLSRDRQNGLGLTGLNGSGSLDGHVAKLRSNGVSSPLGAPSLHPPPRRRAWTASGSPPTSPANGSGFAYTHANASTAETLGVRHNGSAFLSPYLVSPALSATILQSPISSSTTWSPGHAPSDINSRSSSANGANSPSSHPERPRSSWSSVSSLGSSEQTPPRTSFDLGVKRWSRQGVLPKRMTPPSGPPPATPPSALAPLPPPASPSGRSSLSSVQQQRHPYAADSSPSRSPSQRSAHSPQSIMSGLQTFSKRTSGSSARSDSTVSTTRSRATGGSSLFGHGILQSSPPTKRSRAAHRISVPPPQRPAPSIALPPTPTPGVDDFGETQVVPLPLPIPVSASGYPSRPPHSAPAAKTSFRESFTLRAGRFSLTPPTLPPSASLPPRPDEGTVATPRISFHRRSSSSGNPNLPTIPASPNLLVPPSPPPSGPLPAPPTSTPAPAPSRPTLLIRRRLRILSAPAPVPPPFNPFPNPPSPAPSTINPYSLPPSHPPTPIGEPIMTFQNDFSFMSVTTPPQSPMTPAQPILSPPPLLPPPPPEQSPEMHGITSLSPPPRRGSRQITALQTEEDSDEREDDGKDLYYKLDSFGDSPGRKPLSLSPQQSAASLEDVRT